MDFMAFFDSVSSWFFWFWCLVLLLQMRDWHLFGALPRTVAVRARAWRRDFSLRRRRFAARKRQLAAGCWSVALWVNQTSRVSLSPLLCSSTSVNCKGRKKGQHKPGRSGENVRLQTDSIIFTSWRAAALLLLTFRFLGVESGNEMLGGGVGEVSVCNSRCR